MTQEEATQFNHEQIALGHEAEMFLSTPLGRYMRDRAGLEIERAKIALTKVDPHNTKEIQRLQNIAERHSDFEQWLQDVITNGRVVYDEYVSSDE